MECSVENLELAKWRENLIMPALSCRKGSYERSEAVDRLTRQNWQFPNGRTRSLTRATVYNWIRAYEADGLNGLMRKRRNDHNHCKALVTLKWDQFFARHIPNTTRILIGEELDKEIQSFEADDRIGWRTVCHQSTEWLWHRTNALRIEAFNTLPLGYVTGRKGDLTQIGLCKVNRRRAERQRFYD